MNVYHPAQRVKLKLNTHIYMADSQTLELGNSIWEAEAFSMHSMVFIL